MQEGQNLITKSVTDCICHTLIHKSTNKVLKLYTKIFLFLLYSTWNVYLWMGISIKQILNMEKLLIKGVFILILEEAMMNGSCGQGKNKIFRRFRNNKYYYACWRLILSNLLML